MEMHWQPVFDFSVLSLTIILGTILKRKVPIFGKILIPNAILAGFIGFLINSEGLSLVSIAPERLGEYVYHLMAIGFIALALKQREVTRTGNVFRVGCFIVSTYVLQGILGFGLSLFFFLTFIPDIFPSFGLLLPLGFGQGPGQAYSIGTQWEAMGFSHGGNIGLTIATIGFLWACIGGVIFINLLRKFRTDDAAAAPGESHTHRIFEEDEGGDIPLSESIDRITIQVSMIGLVYLLTYLTLLGLTKALSGFGTFGATLSNLLWGFHFILGSVYGLAFNGILSFLQKKKIVNRRYPNNYLLSRISGGAFDFMIAASITAISLQVIVENAIPLLVITVTGGLLTAWYSWFVAKKVFRNHVTEYAAVFFGTYTGTLSTGMALLREVDPDFRTSVAEEIVLGSGIALILGFPLLLILNIPAIGYMTKQPELYALTLTLLVVYFLILAGLLFYRKRRVNLFP